MRRPLGKTNTMHPVHVAQSHTHTHRERERTEDGARLGRCAGESCLFKQRSKCQPAGSEKLDGQLCKRVPYFKFHKPPARRGSSPPALGGPRRPAYPSPRRRSLRQARSAAGGAAYQRDLGSFRLPPRACWGPSAGAEALRSSALRAPHGGPRRLYGALPRALRAAYAAPATRAVRRRRGRHAHAACHDTRCQALRPRLARARARRARRGLAPLLARRRGPCRGWRAAC